MVSPSLPIGIIDIGGQVTGSITVGDIKENAKLRVYGNTNDVTLSGTLEGELYLEGDFDTGEELTVNDLDGSGKLNLANSSFYGDMLLTNGIPAGTEVFVYYLGGPIDMNDQAVAGNFLVGAVRSGADILNPGELSGHCLFGYVTAFSVTGTIRFTNITSTGDLGVLINDFSGLIDIEGDVDGEIAFESGSDFTSSGVLDIGGSLSGDINAGICNGTIKIGEETVLGSSIHCANGLGSNGLILINDSEGSYDHNGSITIGTVSGSPVSGDYDGCIHINDDGASGNGNLEGRVRIAVCDDDTNDFELCADGDINGTVSLAISSCDDPYDDTEVACNGACSGS